MPDFDQILTTLNLCSSDTREDALKSIIKTTLFEKSSTIELKELTNSIKEIYGFEPHGQELKKVIDQLDDIGEIVIVKTKISLNPDQITELKDLEFKAKQLEETRFQNFQKFVKDKFQSVIDEDDYEILWRAFLQYFYQCFFQYGERATAFLNPRFSADENQKFNNTDILYSVLNEQNRQDLAEILKFTVDNFSDFATSEDIDFIDSLGQKTLSFSSLGLDPTVLQEGFNSELIDWVLFLDTNFLFSILDLHINVEDDACKELLKLLISNPDYIRVKLYYIDLTLKELKHKKLDFAEIDERLTRSAIKALLRSNELDGFSKRYYENLLEQPDKTLHPSKVVDISDVTLKNKRIEIYSTGPQRKTLDDAYMNTRFAEYQTFINDLSEIRQQFQKSKNPNRPYRGLFRSDSQIVHDITLREIILLLRSSIKNKGDIRTLNSVKYFGVTLDDVLIRYDSNEIRKKISEDYPTFFKPSYLLNKFIKILPVKTDNYKKAFIKAVSARGFYREGKKSNDVIKMVAYLRDQGIDDEDLLLNLITEKVFLEKYKVESEKADFNEKEFVENEVNKLYKQRVEELSETQKNLENLKTEKAQDNLKISKLEISKGEQENQVTLYKAIADKLSKRVTALEERGGDDSPYQGKIDFEYEEQKSKLKELESKLKVEMIKRMQIENQIRKPKREAFVRKALLRWQLWAVLYFAISIVIFGVFLFILFINDNDKSSFIEYIQDKNKLNLPLWLLSIIFNVFTGKLVYDRLFNESFKKVFTDKLTIPQDMKEVINVEELA